MPDSRAWGALNHHTLVVSVKDLLPLLLDLLTIDIIYWLPHMIDEGLSH